MLISSANLSVETSTGLTPTIYIYEIADKSPQEQHFAGNMTNEWVMLPLQ
jgi:hypothetical protein